MWKEFQGGAYAKDCVNAMSIALGEGIIPGQQLNYICDPAKPDCMQTKKGCLGTAPDAWCWAGPGGAPLSMEEFLINTDLFDLNMKPYDKQITLGPWQTITAVLQTDEINVRIAEAVGYVQSCCVNGVVTIDGVSDDSKAKWCREDLPHANCPNKEGGVCENNPFHPTGYPISTIQKSNLSPALPFCGCTMGGLPTTEYSGRCSHKADDFYTKYEQLVTDICNAA